MTTLVRFKGGFVCSDEGVLEEGDVWARGGAIIDPVKLFYQEKRAPDLTIDCRGWIVAPGFIDIQINGQVCHPTNNAKKISSTLLTRCIRGGFLLSGGRQRQQLLGQSQPGPAAARSHSILPDLSHFVQRVLPQHSTFH